jgi:hypothetical protein
MARSYASGAARAATAAYVSRLTDHDMEFQVLSSALAPTRCARHWRALDHRGLA